MVINFAFYIAMICLVSLMLVVIYAVLRGPTMIDRVLATNIIGTKAVSLLVLIGVVLGKLDMYIDLALTYALLNFLTLLAVGRFLKHATKVRSNNNNSSNSNNNSSCK
ncbi:MAG: monovalent cation/H+ antiporter complex subunit F [Bdellovibrionota bacterium]